MRRSTHAVAFPLLALALAINPGQLQPQDSDFPEIGIGETVEGFLGMGGPTIGERGPFTVYRFEAAAGTRYGVDLRSSDFDGYLILARPIGGLTEFLREDDDGGSDTDARLRFAADDSGTYLLIAQAYQPGSGGAYTITLDERVLPEPQGPRPLTIGEPIEGRLSEGSSVHLNEFDEELPYDLWVFEGVGNAGYLISLDSEDFDAYLEFGPMSGDELEVTESDDDGGDELNAALRVQLPHDGRFGIRTLPFGEDELGAYTLLVRPFTPGPVARRPIAAGERTAAQLTVEDAVLEDGAQYQEWVYAGSAGERIRISMSSTELDPYLVLGRESADGTFQQLIFNDDGPDGSLDSEIDFTLPEDGEYLIHARSFGGSDQGNYMIEVERIP